MNPQIIFSDGEKNSHHYLTAIKKTDTLPGTRLCNGTTI